MMGVEDDQQRGVVAAPLDAGRLRAAVHQHAEALRARRRPRLSAVISEPSALIQVTSLTSMSGLISPVKKRERRRIG